MVDFDDWRARYDSMSWADHVAFYDREVWANHQDQRHYDSGSAARFLAEVQPERVLELGGWRGELADEMLRAFPWIASWTNLEVCRGAAEHPVARDGRYQARVPGDWPWRDRLAADALVLSHTIEHMTSAQVADLIGAASVTSIYIAAPLNDQPTDWSGYWGSHILDIGWDQLSVLIEASGFRSIPELRMRVDHEDPWEVREARCWRKS